MNRENDTEVFVESTEFTESTYVEQMYGTSEAGAVTSKDWDKQATPSQVKKLFQKAFECIDPGCGFRFTTWLYAERKLLVFFFLHFAATMITWFHFGLIKFEEQRETVPEGAPGYWWKRITPPLEFGSMHAILLQMSLLPLTMCRLTVASLSESFLDRFVPLNRVLRMHIHLGYTMVTIVFFATVFFFVFFGKMCREGDESFCDKFTSEIMCTGYGILGSLLIIGGTSYFRYKIPYELFYAIHHLVFAMYAITIAHTMDDVQRNNGRERSQTFKWFSASLLYYLCDRAAMHINHKYTSRLSSASTVKAANGSKMIILKIERPSLFQFKPGQYLYLKLASIDTHWHPFSIASDPASKELELYIEVFSNKSWTCKLWDILESTANESLGKSHATIEFEIMGPCGTSLAKTEDFSHVLAVGAGTGIVPIMSLLKQHIRQLSRLSPATHLEELEENERRMQEVEIAAEARKGSFFQHFIRLLDTRNGYQELRQASRTDSLQESIRNKLVQREYLLRWREMVKNTAQIRRSARAATRSILGVVILSILPVIGITILGITISWNTIPIDLYYGMIPALKVSTLFFQAMFAVAVFFFWDSNEFEAYIDAMLCVSIPLLDKYWYGIYDTNGLLRPIDIALFSMITIYMTVRLWYMAVKPRRRSCHSFARLGRSNIVDRLEVVWVVRSSALVAKILPDINECWEALQRDWGEDADHVCRFSVYVTEKDAREIRRLKRQLRGCKVFEQGLVVFGRPDLGDLIENHTIELVRERRSSYSLLAFCGSPALASKLHHCKISNDIVTNITGYKKHQMEFVSESYGGVKKAPKDKTSMKDDQDATESSELMTERKEVVYFEI